MAQVWIDPGSYSAYLAATTNLTLSGPQTIDGVAATAGKIILCTAQSDPTTNGPYIVRAGTWDRVVPLISGQEWTVQAGNAGAGKLYQLTSAGPILVGTTSLTISLPPASVAVDGVTINAGGAGSSLQTLPPIPFNFSTGTLGKQGGLYLVNWGAGTTLTVPDTTAADGTQWEIFTRGFAVSIASTSGTANIVWNGVSDPTTKNIGSTLWSKVRVVKMSSSTLRVYAEPSVGEVTAPPASGGWGSRVVFPGETSGAAAAGPVTLTGARVGQAVLAVFGTVTSTGTNVGTAASRAAFESTITVADQIQQTSASNLSANTYYFILGA